MLASKSTFTGFPPSKPKLVKIVYDKTSYGRRIQLIPTKVDVDLTEKYELLSK